MTNPAPRLSVIVPHHDDLEQLDRCLAALEAQTLSRADYEIIVADNRTPAGLAAVERLVAGRARLVDAPIAGAGPARNNGVEHACGNILAFTDCDCIPDPHWLEQGLAALAEADFVGGRMTVLVADRMQMSGAEAFETVFAFDNRDYVLREYFTVTANLFCPRTVFERVGPFRTAVSEDKEWCLRARRLGYAIGYAEGAIVGHPARATYAQLRRKWKRMAAESYALRRDGGGGRLGWLARTWALPPSILLHAAWILASHDLPGPGAKLRAIMVLIRIRLWRFVEGHRLLLRDGKTS